MAKNVTLLSIDDERERATVLFEDTATNFSLQMTAQVPKEYADEAELLDFLATLWPYEAELQRGKSQADRHKELKLIVGATKNITSRVQVGQP